MCEEGSCYATVNDTEDPFFDIKTFSFSAGDLLGLEEVLEFESEIACGETTQCEIWRNEDPVSEVTTAVIEKDSRRIRLMEGLQDGDTVKIRFEYTDIKVILPLYVETLQ